MTDDVVIRAEELGKRYIIGHEAQHEKYVALRDVAVGAARGLWRRTADMARGRPLVAGDTTEEVWALKNLSFMVTRGEVIGIIGRNGAGKSTLLKILSRITEPSAGRVVIRGRVASLLEVGTGFHPELTGRENIYLNGAILGMRRAEITRKFDEIVDFSGVEKFLDTPVKRYSSGMYVRLAFAIAAHLEPEILIVDEVLAVGDIEFQRKCLGKMGDVASKHGRTILFVSHNMAAIESMCSSAMLLVGGYKVAAGETSPTVQAYLNDLNRLSAISLSERNDRKGSGEIVIQSYCMEDLNGISVPTFKCGGSAAFRFLIDNPTPASARHFRMALGIDNEMGQRIALLDTKLLGIQIPSLPPGLSTIRMVIPKMLLMPGRYRITIFTEVDGTIADWIKSAASFDIEPTNYYGTGELPAHDQAMVLLDHRFEVCDGASVGPSPQEARIASLA